MAILSIDEVAEGRWSQSKSRPFGMEYGRRFIVRSDTQLETEANVIAAGPSLGTAHPDDSFAVCIQQKPTQIKKLPDHYWLNVKYSTLWDQIETEDDPADWRDKVRVGTVYHERPLVVDAITGDAVLNKAGDPFDPPIMYEVALTSISVQRHYSSRPTWLFSHRNTRNDAALTIGGTSIALGQGRIRDLTISDEKHSNAFPYFTADIEIEVDDIDTHQAQVLNDGMNQLVLEGATYKKRPCMVREEPAQSPQPLDALGRQIDPTTLPGAAVVLQWHRYPLSSWGVIGFPP